MVHGFLKGVGDALVIKPEPIESKVERISLADSPWDDLLVVGGDCRVAVKRALKDAFASGSITTRQLAELAKESGIRVEMGAHRDKSRP